jgi:hypothetical protein
MRPSDEDALLAGLRALREKVAGDAPPVSVRTALVAEFRRRQSRNEANLRRKPLLWMSLAAAAALLIVILATHRQTPPVIRTEAPPKPVVTVAEGAPEPPPTVVVQPVRRKIRRAPPQRQQPAPDREVATEFLALPYAPRFTSEDRGQLVRVRLPRESMRSFGLPVNEDRIVNAVKADVLIGEDGIARAIRFVQ